MLFAGLSYIEIIVFVLGCHKEPIASRGDALDFRPPGACAGDSKLRLRPTGCRQRESRFALQFVAQGVGVIEGQPLAG